MMIPTRGPAVDQTTTASSNPAPPPSQGYEDSGVAERIRHVGTDFHLNAPFVTSVGGVKAEAFRATLQDVGTTMHHRTRAEIRRVLADRMAEIDVTVHPVELEKFADEIARSDWVAAHVG